jgi:hypothetical protein
MTLAQMTWTPVTLHKVVADFLQSERHRVNGPCPVIDAPDLTNPAPVQSAHAVMPELAPPEPADG